MMSSKNMPLGCNVEFPYFGANYPDARCVDGNLLDMDKCDEEGNLFTSDEDNPCPFCRREEFIQNKLDDEIPLHAIEKCIEYIKENYITRHIKI